LRPDQTIIIMSINQQQQQQQGPPPPDSNFVIDDEPTDTSYNNEGEFANEPGTEQFDPYAVQPGVSAASIPAYTQPTYDVNGQPIEDPFYTGQQYDENGQPIPQYDENGNPYYIDENGQPYYADDDGDNNNDNYDDLPPVDNGEYNAPPAGDDKQRETAPEQPRRQRPERNNKYSTANMAEDGKCKKYLSICALFLLFLAVMIGLSMLFNHFFFSDKSDNGPADLDQRDANSTFPKDKQEIDGACSRGNYRMEPQLCEDACAPQYFKCCDPFDEKDLYNFTEVVDTTNSTEEVEDGKSRSSIPELNEKNFTFLEGYEDWEPMDGSICRFDEDLRGCMSYAKCQVLSGQMDAAPGNLPDLCSLEQLGPDGDPESCKALCRPVDCCYSTGSDNCLAEKFDLCMDYAPCQNLRALEGHNDVLETAPRTLDFDCFWQQPTCTETCEKAACCGDKDSSCLQLNFMSCLTYAPCNNVTLTNITVGQQFNTIPKPPSDIIYACNAKHEAVLEPTEKTCEEYCTEAACCWASDSKENCFFEDPLGCMAYEAQCQVLLDGPQ